MPRSMWRGVIAFGLVSIPVRLYVATESHSVSFRQLCAEHLAPIRYKRWCEAGDHEVPYPEIVKGYEVSSDNFVVLEEGDLEKLPLPTARTIEIAEFVPADDIRGGLLFKSAYYIEPEETGRKPYHLLRKALTDTSTTAIAKVAFREREHLCALQALNGELLMNTLHWPDEIRTTEGLKGLDEDVRVSPRELQMARSLVESLSEPTFDASRFQDEYQQALMQVVNAKIEGAEVVTVPEAQAPPVQDLMEALKASVDAAKKQRAERVPARKTTRARAKSA